MKILIHANAEHRGHVFHGGQIYDLDESTAGALLASGKAAVHVDAPPRESAGRKGGERVPARSRGSSRGPTRSAKTARH